MRIDWRWSLAAFGFLVLIDVLLLACGAYNGGFQAALTSLPVDFGLSLAIGLRFD